MLADKADILQYITMHEKVDTLNWSGPSADELVAMDGHEGMISRIQAQYPVLEHEAQIALATQFQAGIQAAERLENISDYTIEQRVADEHTIAAGEKAKETLFLSNIGLVLSRANIFYRTPLGQAYGKDELFTDGLFGLDRAIEKFDPARGLHFSTYAYYWIDTNMQRALQKWSLIRVPDNYNAQVNKVAKLDDEQASDADIQSQLSISAQELVLLRSIRVGHFAVSIDTPIRTSSDGTDRPALSETIGDTTNVDDYDRAIEAIDATRNSEVDSSVDSTIPESPLLTSLQAILNSSELALMHKIFDDTELTDGETRYKFRLRKGLFAHPAMYTKLKQYLPNQEEDTDWRDQAACTNYFELFMRTNHIKQQQRSLIINICAGCAVSAQCRQYFVENRPERSVWVGGQRNDAWKRRKARLAKG